MSPARSNPTPDLGASTCGARANGVVSLPCMQVRSRSSPPVPSVTPLVWRFAATGLAAMAAVVVGSVLLSRSVGTEVALDEARRISRLTGLGIVEPAVTAGVLEGDPASLDTLHQLVTDAVLDGSLVRVKIWLPRDDGRAGEIIYSDEGRLIGETYVFAEDKVDALREELILAETTDLTEPENRFESDELRLLEVYLPIEGPDGQRLLYETYFDRSRVDEAGRRVWIAFAPLMIGSLLLLQVIQVPLAWSLARRLRISAAQRQTLLERSIEASSLERRRIAADLHDGVVQDLTGLSLELTAVSGADDTAQLRRSAAEGGTRLRRSVGALRSLLVDIYPPDLQGDGLAAALEDLLARHRSAGVRVEFEVDLVDSVPTTTAELVYRIVQEGLRNIARHAGASQVRLHLTAARGRLALSLEDDGRGFDVEQVVAATGHDHFGMRLLSDSARELGGVLRLASAPEAGTLIELEVPL